MHRLYVLLKQLSGEAAICGDPGDLDAQFLLIQGSGYSFYIYIANNNKSIWNTYPEIKWKV